MRLAEMKWWYARDKLNLNMIILNPGYSICIIQLYIMVVCVFMCAV